MGACKTFIQRMKKELPELCDVKVLVSFGLFKSDQQAYNLRKAKSGPEYFRLNKHYYYPKEAIIEYLECGSAE